MPPIVLVLSYAFCADRTSLFNKLHKKHDPRDFYALNLIIFAFGILTIRRVVKPVRNTRQGSKGEDQPILSRDQTDEWKGWMQALILIYHYTGCSQILGIYKFIRILVASYLFLTGFGHTLYFYQRSDYSLHRCAAVLIRLNFLTCLLSYAMGTDYLFYYFTPLITFWYMIIYLTMSIGHSRNSNLLFLVAKMIVSACSVTLLIRVPQVLETVFIVLRHTCNIHWDVSEWRFRMQLDAYIVFVGMLAGIAYAKVLAILDEEQSENPSILSVVRRYWIWPCAALVAGAIVGLQIYWRFATLFSNKVDHNQWFPYLSWLPILSFVILRNCTRDLRNFRSSLFVWLGRHSLETFILQYHIWLAADTKGILSLGIFGRTQTNVGRWAEFVLFSTVFLWMSWCAAKATEVMTVWIVGPRNIDERGGERGRWIELPLRDTSSEDRAPAQIPADAKPAFITRVGQWLCRHLRQSLPSRLALIGGILCVLNWVSRVGAVTGRDWLTRRSLADVLERKRNEPEAEVQHDNASRLIGGERLGYG